MLRIAPFVFALSCLAAGYAAPEAAKQPQKTPPAPQTTKAFKSFTGKVAANKVRIRVKPDLESHIIRQAGKNDLLLVVGEEGDFYAVEPPKETKAYVFRSYVLDGIVEASRVNVRLEPHVDAPIIGQLQAGDKIDSQICPLNHKWLETAPPKSAKFYVSKEYISQAGGPEYLALMEKRKAQVDELLSTAYSLAEAECKKPFEEMSPEKPIELFQTLLRNFSDFTDKAAQAKEGLALLKETYLNKKIAYLEAKTELSPIAKADLIAKHKAETKDLSDAPIDPKLWEKKAAKRELGSGTQFWDTLEESLYLSWSAFHQGKKSDAFYAEQKANATLLTGTIESYPYAVKEAPGNFVLRGDEAPLAYLYSTQVDLEKHVGKKLSLVVSPRPNNHFAFPAYFVLEIEP